MVVRSIDEVFDRRRSYKMPQCVRMAHQDLVADGGVRASSDLNFYKGNRVSDSPVSLSVL